MSVRTNLQDVLAGAVGGAVGTLVMEQAGNLLYALESDAKREREEALRSKPPYQVMAEKAGRAVGRELTEDQAGRAGTALHWAYGLGWGVLYALVRKRARPLARAGGLPFAALFFLVGDEGVNWALGTTPPPQEFPWEAHARGLAGHAIFIAVVELVCRGMGR